MKTVISPATIIESEDGYSDFEKLIAWIDGSRQ